MTRRSVPGLMSVGWGNGSSCSRGGRCRRSGAQSTPPDGWLLFLDADTPVDHLDALHELVGKDAEIVLSQEHLTGQRIGEIINHRLPPSPSVLLTTRLDSDDALAVSHLQRVRADPSFRGFVNPASGLQLVGGEGTAVMGSQQPIPHPDRGAGGGQASAECPGG